FDARYGEIVEKPGEESLHIRSLVACGIYKVHAQDSDGLLLLRRGQIAQVDVQEHLAGLGIGCGLKANAQPSVLLVRALIIAGSDGIGKNKEPRILPTS